MQAYELNYMEQTKSAETPLMRQYSSFKEEYPEAILLFRVGDFYETFGEDAVTASRVLGIVLTKRNNGTPGKTELAGFPHHALDTYLPKLVRAGYKVAVCDQLEDPKLTKKLVKRGITELVTPGVVYNDSLLSNKENNYLVSVHIHKDTVGAAFLDVSTGTFKAAQGSEGYISLLISSMSPKEVLVRKGNEGFIRENFGDSIYITRLDEWAFSTDSCMNRLERHFGEKALKGFGVQDMTVALTAAGAALSYLEMTHHNDISHISSITRIDGSDFVWMDRFTFRNLEVFRSLNEAEGGISLLQVMDNTVSPMGGRTLRSWLATPLKDIKAIEDRLECVDELRSSEERLEKLRGLMSMTGDMERIVAKAAAGKILPREMLQLRRGLDQTGPIIDACRGCSGLEARVSSIDTCDSLRERMRMNLLEDPAAQIGKGDVIAKGADPELDRLREMARNSKALLNGILEKEIRRTGIATLKIGYNNVFGYYLEVRNTHKEKVPAEWIRKQTLVNAERYITPELKEYEEQILGAEDRITILEQQIYNSLVSEVQTNVRAIRNNACAIGELDTLAGFAFLSLRNRYCRPHINGSDAISITKGRHPVIETMMQAGEEYIANDIAMDCASNQIMILTGPNMAGKSALLRQTALIVLMAQTGCFVPAESAEIGYVDKIFTRVGASDNISKGESTFMVEMLETATILHNLSSRSLVLLDEIGRGTSTYDGMSIAWAIVEYIHESPFRAKTLFATHYHELNELENTFERVHNYHISTKETDGKVIFLRKLCRGGVAHSFGIHVAKAAGMPTKVVHIAEKKLRSLEDKRNVEQTEGTSLRSRIAERRNRGSHGNDALQLNLFQLDDPLLADIRKEIDAADLDMMSPLDAFDLIRKLKKKLGNG